MPVRLKDLAQSLGLSVSTVSAALHGRSDINPSTRQRVLQKARDLNYHPNRLAHGLATRESRILGIVVPNLSRPFFPHVLEGIDDITDPEGYTFVVFNTDDDPVREDRGITTLVSSQVEGLIIASAKLPRKNMWKSLSGSGVPFVLMDRLLPGAPFVGADDEQIGFIVTQHLIEQGYRSIAHLSARTVVTGYGRYRGYVRALQKAGMTISRRFVCEVPWREMEGGYKITRQLLRSRPLPHSIFAVNDMVGIGAMKAIQEAGLSIPDEIGLIAVGNVRYGDCLSVPMSTVDLHPKEVGKTAASLLLRRIKGEEVLPQPVFLDPTLIVRRSSRRAADSRMLPAQSIDRPETSFGGGK